MGGSRKQIIKKMWNKFAAALAVITYYTHIITHILFMFD